MGSEQDAQLLSGKRILLGICGGIAAYKAPDLVRKLRACGADVQVVTTAAAEQFVTTASLQAVSGNPVRNDLWDPAAEASMGHIELARWADAVLIAPATANCLAKLANGLADDLLSTLCLATTAPVCIAPAMNVRMWQHPATQANLATLATRSQLLGPAEGDQACGEYGPGRMLEPQQITDQLAQRLAGVPASGGPTSSSSEVAHMDPVQFDTQLLAGVNIVITAGPTRELIDPVRYISNRSSGKQGYAIAAQAAAMGASVNLISGPTALETPPGVNRIDVLSANEMFDAVHSNIANADLFVGVAAVADYRVAEFTDQKIKKADDNKAGMSLQLVTNPDIIASVAGLENPPVTIGFAAETQTPVEHARTKRLRKKLDMIVVNDVSDSRIGFRSEHNAVTLIWESGEERLPRQDKTSIAQQILTRLAELFVDRLVATNPQTQSN